MRFEHHRDALGVGEHAPRLSWRAASAPEDWWQAGYEVEVDSTCYRVESPDSVLVPWPAEGPALALGPAALQAALSLWLLRLRWQRIGRTAA